MNYTRKLFLKTLGLGSLVAGTNLLQGAPINRLSSLNPSLNEDSNLTLGLASYSTRKFSLDKTLLMAKRLNLKHVAFKSMHMPLDSSDEALAGIAQKVQKEGLILYGAGVIYMKSAEEVENVFRYAKAAQLSVIIGVPNHDLLPLVEKKVKETNIKLAIHNHGPGDEVYPTPEVVYDKIKSLDSRIGLCIDIGHVKRLGLDPVKNIKKYADRLYDLHLKDVTMAAADGKSVEFGRGVIDLPAVLKALKEIKYAGVMALEFEENPDDVMPGLAACAGYANGVLDMLK